MKLHLIWDMDGTLVNSEPEILATIQKALATIGLSLKDACQQLRVGPPLPVMLRSAFDEDILSEDDIQKVIKTFRQIYDASDFENTKPYDGIDEIIRSKDYVHHIITNKPDFATRCIIEKKGWNQYVSDVLSPNTLMNEMGRQMKKQELFQYFKTNNPELKVVGIGDMAGDADCAHAAGIPAIGVLWGTGTKEELVQAECEAIVSDSKELVNSLKTYLNE